VKWGNEKLPPCFYNKGERGRERMEYVICSEAGHCKDSCMHKDDHFRISKCDTRCARHLNAHCIPTRIQKLQEEAEKN
jgi:hypothetical protein